MNRKHVATVFTMSANFPVFAGVYHQSAVTLFTFLGWKRKLEPELSLLRPQLCGIRFMPVLNLIYIYANYEIILWKEVIQYIKQPLKACKHII